VQDNQLKSNAEFAPLVSIIIPSYNSGRFLERTLISIFNQDYPNIEIIIIDGGSTDNTADILKKYGHQIKLLSETDEGEYCAINKGIKMTGGKYIKVIPADDLLHPKATSLFVDYMERHPEAALAYGQFVFIDQDNNILRYSIQYQPFSLKGYLRGKFSHGSMTMMVRKIVFDELGLFDTTYCYQGDFEFISRVASKGLRVVDLPLALGGFRIYPEQQSVKKNKIINKQRRAIIRKYGTMLDLILCEGKQYYFITRSLLGKIKWTFLGLLGKGRYCGGNPRKFEDLY
jgi:glycosyltransferase involved in cell wall biosynthesis